MLSARRMEFVSSLNKIKVTRLAMRQINGAKVSFELDADFHEISRGNGKVKLSYILTVDTLPVIQRATVEGFATVEEDLVQSADVYVLNELALAIFKQHYEPIYLLFDTLSLAAPSPWLVREVKLVS